MANHELMTEMLLEKYRGHNLVFIVGCPRSGTTWLQRLLACHPKVRTGFESDLFDMYIGPQLRAWRRDLDPQNSGRVGVGLACYFRNEEFHALLKEYMLKLLEPMVGQLLPGELFVEKTPSHALFIPEILELLPESRIIHILRDGRDVVASLLAASRSWGAYWAPRHVWSAARMWIEHVRAVRAATKTITKEQFYELRYEDLHAWNLELLKGVCCFLQLDWDEAAMKKAIAENQPEVAKVSGGTAIPVGGEVVQLSGPIVKEPLGFVRRARPGTWKEDLSLQEKILLWLLARKTMEEVGYHWAFPW